MLPTRPHLTIVPKVPGEKHLLPRLPAGFDEYPASALGENGEPEPDDAPPTAIRTPRDLALRSARYFERHAKVGVQRKIDMVIDKSAPEGHRRRSTASVLDPLTQTAYSAFRRELRQAHERGNDLYCCATCEQPVYATAIEENCDGQSAFFSHFPGGAQNCDLDIYGRPLASVNADKFGGNTESEEHQHLKRLLAAALTFDTAFADIRVEKRVGDDEHWRRPDVSAAFHGRGIAFEIQLSRPHLVDSLARETFYQQRHMHLVWLTTPARVGQLVAQGFQDVFWANDGQILAFDMEAYSATEGTGELHFWVLTVVATLVDGRVVNDWHKCLLPRSEISFNTISRRPHWDEVGYEQSLRACLDATVMDLPAALLEAVTGNDAMARGQAESYWTQAATQLNIGPWREAAADGMFEAIGALATVAAAQKRDATLFKSLTTIVDRFLATPVGRDWTAMLVEVAQAHGHAYLLTQPRARQLIAANLAAATTDFGRQYALALSMLFPPVAIRRLARVPELRTEQ